MAFQNACSARPGGGRIILLSSKLYFAVMRSISGLLEGVISSQHLVLSARIPAAIFVVILATPLPAATVMLRPVADTTLFERFPDNNLGGLDTLAADGVAIGESSRALLKFDINSALPPFVVITSARLTVTAVKRPTSGGTTSTFELRRVLRDWQEGTGTGLASGRLATTGETTWNAQFHDQASWGQPGGETGLDFATVSSGAVSVSGLGPYLFDSTAGLTADVRAWLTNASSNYGWVLISRSETTPETARRFGSRESTDKAPELVLDFDLPQADQPRIDPVKLLDDKIFISFNAMSGQSYNVEFTEGIAPAQWNLLTNVPAPRTNLNTVITDSIAVPRRFYRLRLP